MQFELDGKEYTIGSDMFPLSDISKVRSFSHENTEPFSHEEFSKIIDINKFEIGHCYTNAEMLRMIGEKIGVNADYYSGWLFFQSPRPIHHAWCVIDGKHVIDMGFSERDIRFMKKIAGDSNWRERYADNVAYRRTNIRPSKDCIMGKVPDGILFVGSPDEIDASRKLFTDTMKKYPNHVSYEHKGMNPTGESTIQKLIREQYGRI